MNQAPTDLRQHNPRGRSGTTLAHQMEDPPSPSQQPPFGALGHWGKLLDRWATCCSEGLSHWRYAVLLLFCIGYAYTTCFRASKKLFWFDELFTVQLARLPDLASTWNALKQGADLNPPLIYELTRLSELLLGEGHVATRLPAIISFGIFCLCLFRFVSIRTSPLGGFVSMLFPLVTTAYWYAYEARPHGIVLGFCGLSLICWQAATMHTERRLWWLVGLGSALSLALLTHAYGVLLFLPVTIGELVRSASSRRIDWPVWTTIAIASLAVLPAFVLMQNLEVATAQVQFDPFAPAPFSPASLTALADAYRYHLVPAVGVIAGGLLLLCITKLSTSASVVPVHAHNLPLYELVALFTFVAIPVFQYALSKLTGTPFFHRYSISTVVGFACLLGIAAATRPLVGIGVLLLSLGQIGIDFFHYARTGFISEPSTSLTLSTHAPWFNRRYISMAAAADKQVPIVLLDSLEFLPTFYYAPPSLASRLVYVIWSKYDGNGIGYVNLQNCCNAVGKVTRSSDFLSSHPSFLAHGGPRTAYQVSEFIQAGATVSIEDISSDHFLVFVTFKKKTNSVSLAP